jgi:hypothetical protein
MTIPYDFKLLRFQCSQCESALNLVAVDRTQDRIINLEFLCFNCLIGSGIVTAKEAEFLYVTGVQSTK